MPKSFKLSLDITAALASGFKSTFSGAEKTLAGLGKSIQKLQKVQDSLGRADKLKTSMAATRKELAATQREMTRLGRASMAGGVGNLARDFDRAREKSDRLKASLGKQAGELRQLKTTLAQAGTATNDFAGGQARAAKQVAALQKAQARIQGNRAARRANLDQRAALQGRLLGAAGKGLTLGVPITIAANFEQSMAEVGAVARLDLAGEDFARLTAEARRLGAATEWSASQAGEGMKYLAMAGFGVNQMLDTMPGMLDLATAGSIDLGSAADISSNILSGFKMHTKDMGRLGDVLVNTFTSSNTSLAMLGETMKYVAPVAQALGVSVEMTAAMAGKLGGRGYPGIPGRYSHARHVQPPGQTHQRRARTPWPSSMSRLATPAATCATWPRSWPIWTEPCRAWARRKRRKSPATSSAWRP